jgi:hypothetical protein
MGVMGGKDSLPHWIFIANAAAVWYNYSIKVGAVSPA